MALTENRNDLTTIADDSDIVDIVFPEVRKKRFRIDGDNNKILELDTSDMSIINRLEPTYKKLNSLVEDAVSSMAINEEDDADDTVIEKTAQALTEIDGRMRNLIDELFDADVSATCAPKGSMYDLYNGKYRFEYILEVLFGLYEKNIAKEFEKLSERMEKHTAKYTKK